MVVAKKRWSRGVDARKGEEKGVLYSLDTLASSQVYDPTSLLSYVQTTIEKEEKVAGT